VTPWFLAHGDSGDKLASVIALHRAGVAALRAGLKANDEDKARITEFGMAKMPEDLATDLGLLPRLAAAPDVTLLAHDAKAAPGAVAALYFALGSKLGLDRLRMLAVKLILPEHWDRLALRRLLDDLSAAQRGIARNLLDGGTADGPAAVEQWADAHAAALERTRSFLAALESSGELSISKLMLASSQVQALA